ncbi:MAG: DUF1385 domain-containing protein [Peptostreptococcaceae bacterium]|nr:DUF1385 domain-containing protein [Peptostreptococcaceae bacterium]
MDLKKIFLKDACPTQIGGQAIMEGIMMKGENRTAIAMRLPDDRIYLRTEKNKKRGKLSKIPIVRGVVVFINSLVTGTGTLMKSAEILERFTEEDPAENSKFEKWVSDNFSMEKAWNILLVLTVILSLLFTVVVFVLFPTAAVNWLGRFTDSVILLNLVEGVFRIVLFVAYVLLISKMEDIKRVFQYHGAEHKTIHCLEKSLELTPENAQQFYTLHPRCGTSFLVFVMVISLIVFSLMGWPNLLIRLLSRILLIPVVAGLSYELLRWAGRSNNLLVEILSMPGLYLQKITTKEPDDKMLEVAIVAVKAVLVDDDAPLVEGISDLEGNIITNKEDLDEFKRTDKSGNKESE